MAVDVIMPKLGESITEATILEWKVDVGSVVSQDETILEIDPHITLFLEIPNSKLYLLQF